MDHSDKQQRTDGAAVLHNDLVIGESKGRGLGVFAARAYQAGEIVAIAPVLPLDEVEAEKIAKTRLRYYYYRWKTDRDGCICLGLGSLVNHSFYPNTDYRRDYVGQSIVFAAVQPIAPGDEITINYGGSIDARDPVDFDVV